MQSVLKFYIEHPLCEQSQKKYGHHMESLLGR